MTPNRMDFISAIITQKLVKFGSRGIEINYQMNPSKQATGFVNCGFEILFHPNAT